MRNIYARVLFPIFFVFSVFVSCSDFHNDLFTEIKNIAGGSGTEIQSFSLCGTELTIAGNTITGNIPFYENIYSAAASFKTNGIDVRVDGVTQKSGSTVNDFSGDVVYTVYSNNGTSRQYTVSVTNYGVMSQVALSGLDGSNPCGIAWDGANFYIAGYSHSAIYKIDTSLSSAVFSSGHSYKDVVFHDNAIYAIDPNYVYNLGSLGTGTDSYLFSYVPWGIASDGTNIYVSTTQKKIIEFSTADLSNPVDFCSFSDTPFFMSVMGDYIYVSMTEAWKIVKLHKTSLLSSYIAGSGSPDSVDGTGASAGFAAPRAISNDGTFLYIADGKTVRKMTPEGRVSTISGDESAASDYVEGFGPNARYKAVYGVVWVADHKALYVTDSSANTLSKISAE